MITGDDLWNTNVTKQQILAIMPERLNRIGFKQVLAIAPEQLKRVCCNNHSQFSS